MRRRPDACVRNETAWSSDGSLPGFAGVERGSGTYGGVVSVDRCFAADV